MVSMILPTMVRAPLVGYRLIVLAIVATGFTGFGVWVHHMFTTGVLQLASSFFTASSVMITIPTAIQIFCWIATIWLGRPWFATPMLFLLGFFITFVIGGLTGVMLASVPLDSQVHDTHFVVAHLHYVLLGGGAFPLFAAIYYWYPKWTGRMYHEGLGKLHFWLWIVGVNVTFFPLHILGLSGMPRRIYTYPEGMGWTGMNQLATVGSYILALSVITFVVNMVLSARRGALAGNDPWAGDSLEWATTSPPRPYSFVRPPVVQGRGALWSRTPDAPEIVGMPTDRRMSLVTSAMDAEPDNLHEEPGPTVWPFIASLAVAVLFIWLMFHPMAVLVGGALLMLTLLGWGWPRGKKNARHDGAVDPREAA